MDLKDLLGDAYKEGMTLEEINEALKGKKLVDPETLPKTVTKETFDKTASELAKYKKELRELKEKSMTDEEKIQAELDKATGLQSQFQKELAKIRAKEIFVEAGLKAEDYSLILDSVVTENEETTQTRAQSMVKLIAAQRKAVEDSVKAELLKNTPKPEPGSGGITGDTLAKEIEKAQERGDMVTVASLIRQQAELEAKQDPTK